MALKIDKVNIGDLVQELSPDALRYYSEMVLSDEWAPHDNALRGKFVRLGEIILIGAAIEYGPADHYGDRRHIKHIDMLWHGMRGMGQGVQDRICETAPKEGNYLNRKWPLVDAGRSRIQIDCAGQPRGLVLDDRSFDYGRPDPTARQRTGEIAQLVLGANFHVAAE